MIPPMSQKMDKGDLFYFMQAIHASSLSGIHGLGSD
jgi:hypothetical protein